MPPSFFSLIVVSATARAARTVRASRRAEQPRIIIVAVGRTVKVSANRKASKVIAVATVAIAVARRIRVGIVSVTTATTTVTARISHADIAVTIAANTLITAIEQRVKQATTVVTATASATVTIAITTASVRIPNIPHSISLPLVYLMKNLIIQYMQTPRCCVQQRGVIFTIFYYSHSIVPEGFGVKS